MIVNPQLFNYRLIIGSLLVILSILGFYSYSSYKSIKSHEDFLVQEKILIEKELSDMITSYEDLSLDNNLIASQLEDAKSETKSVLDSLRLLKSDLSIIARYKNQLSILKSKSKLLALTIDSLNSANKTLKKEKRYALNTVEKKTIEIDSLEKKNDSLNKTIDNAAILKASNINAQAYKLRSGNKKFTEKARRANAIDVCVMLTENPLTLKGKKDIYVQIVGPNGNVLSDKGEVVFGDTSLIYSKKEVVDYDNQNLQICTTILVEDNDKPLLKGYYFITVFHKNAKLGSTSIKLK